MTGSYQDGAYKVVKLELTPRHPKRHSYYTLHVDLDSYAVLRFREYNRPGVRDLEFEAGYAPHRGKWYTVYEKKSLFTSYQGQSVLEEQLYLVKRAEWEAEAKVPNPVVEPLLKFYTRTLDHYQIPWDDPYWQSRPSVPWPDWVAKRLEAEGLAR